MKPTHALPRHDRQVIEALFFVNAEDTRRFNLLRALMASARIIEVIADHDLQKTGLSLPRLRLLMRLHIEEHLGNQEGVSPSELSQHQHISKNTISSLLASLEDQKLIERTLSSEDKRSFKIRLTQTGRQLVQSTLPEHNVLLEQLFAALNTEEQKTLLKILTKLRGALVQQLHASELDSYKTTLE